MFLPSLPQQVTLYRGLSLGSIVALDTMLAKLSANFFAGVGKESGIAPLSSSKCVKLVVNARLTECSNRVVKMKSRAHSVTIGFDFSRSYEGVQP